LLPDPKATGTDVPEGTIFEELVLQYDKLVDRAEEMLVQLICGEVESHLKTYFARCAIPVRKHKPVLITPSQAKR
jgi:hypothetical protein